MSTDAYKERTQACRHQLQRALELAESAASLAADAARNGGDIEVSRALECWDNAAEKVAKARAEYREHLDVQVDQWMGS